MRDAGEENLGFISAYTLGWRLRACRAVRHTSRVAYVACTRVTGVRNFHPSSPVDRRSLTLPFYSVACNEGRTYKREKGRGVECTFHT